MVNRIILNGEGLSKVTQKVVKDFNVLNDVTFFTKYSVTKGKYLKRFIRYGDPYMKAPLAKIGKLLAKLIH